MVFGISDLTEQTMSFCRSSFCRIPHSKTYGDRSKDHVTAINKSQALSRLVITASDWVEDADKSVKVSQHQLKYYFELLNNRMDEMTAENETLKAEVTKQTEKSQKCNRKYSKSSTEMEKNKLDHGCRYKIQS